MARKGNHQNEVQQHHQQQADLDDAAQAVFAQGFHSSCRLSCGSRGEKLDDDSLYSNRAGRSTAFARMHGRCPPTGDLKQGPVVRIHRKPAVGVDLFTLLQPIVAGVGRGFLSHCGQQHKRFAGVISRFQEFFRHQPVIGGQLLADVGIPVLQENFYTSLIEGRIPASEIEKYLKQCTRRRASSIS